ncbi:Aste57867_22815 [Aphanomyces stellatus]|nr:hypothetical protein As57867_022745 [Aphanomyces stellatus]VFT99466.1 Aste57867_22815 [Aphanomyces stellatus]
MATSRRSSVTQGNNAIKVSPGTARLHKSARTGSCRVPEGESSTTALGDVDWMTKGANGDDDAVDNDEAHGDKTSTLAADVFLLLQDREGVLHLVDCDKREMHGVNMEVKILHNSNVTLG